MNIETTWKYGQAEKAIYFTPGEESWLRISLKEIPKGKYSLYFDIIKDPQDVNFHCGRGKNRYQTGYQHIITRKRVKRPLYL